MATNPTQYVSRKLKNRVKLQTPALLTADILLSACTPVAGFSTFTASVGDVVSYTLIDGDNWELGFGFFETTALTMKRNNIDSSTGSKLSLTGDAILFLTAISNDLGLNTPSIGKALTSYQYSSGKADEINTSWVNVEYFCSQQVPYTLTSTTASQKLFNTSTNGSLTLPVGTYRYNCNLYVSNNTGTTSNLVFGVLGSGTATSSGLGYVYGFDAAANAATTLNGSYFIGNTSSNTVSVTGTTATLIQLNISGILKVTVAGTIVPSVKLTTAAAAVVEANTSFTIKGLESLDTSYFVP